ncbi:MAG TPA: right-handed parallel beta-helix repeat-containing protein [Puia sp.]|jgi:parallel beta-helix repeat protein|nr:right-handed parallel beta-helix repeat-containing protein [Puia sp.]
MPIFLGIIPAFGNTYYFSANSGDDTRSPAQAQQASTPWKTLAKLNQIFPQLQPGDSVLLKRGEAYYGSIVAGASGADGRPIVIAAYGQGYEPIISGFSRLTGWKAGGANGVWQAPCQGCGVRVNMVTVANVAQPMGRYPNGGYLTIQSHSGNNSITDNSLPGSTDWTGAEVVIRKNRFIIDRSAILSQQGGTLTYKGGSYYQPTDHFGYFIQNDIRTLDQPGEWYYDPKAHTMNIFYGGGPVPPDVMASSVETLLTIQGKQNLVLTGLTFTGSNGNAISLSDAANIIITACHIYFTSLDGVNAVRSNNLTLSHLTIDHSNDNGIDISGHDNTVSDCTVRHTGTVPGMGNAEHSYIGINISGQNNTVQYNKVDTSGYVGIFFLGGPDLIKNNTVNYFCYLKDDGGGIYTWSGDIDSAAVRNAGVITGNIILNGVTAPDGTDKAHAAIANGIYLDENTSGAEVSDNTIAHCTSGIFLQDAHEVTVKGNTVFDNAAQIEMRHALDKGTLRNNDISGNTAVAAKDGQVVMLVSSGVTSGVGGNVAAFAGVHDNHYAQTGGGPFYKAVMRQNNQNVQDKGALGDWQSKYGKDANSVKSAPSGGVRFEFNDSKAVKSVTLDGTYKDPGGKTFQGQLKLEPYTSKVLIRQ